MNGLAAFLLATPLFGFALTPPSATLSLPPGGAPAHLASLPMSLHLEVDAATPTTATTPDGDAPPSAAPDGDAPPSAAPDGDAAPSAAPDGDATPALTVPAPATAPAESAAEEMSEEDRRFLEETRLRRDIGAVHRILGISTWASMTLTSILGFIQYYDLYGIQASQADAPCTTGHAVLQDFCAGAPWPHRISVIATSALYVATFSLSLAMPDPNHVSEGSGAFAERIRIHQVLRWIHLAGMVAQTVLGLGVANGWFGDRANNYDTLQAIAGVHQAIGWTTWFTVGLAGAIMIF